MIDVIFNKEYELAEFPSFIDYLTKLGQENFLLLSDKEEYGWREIIFQNEEEFLEILIYTDEEKEWISIYKFKEKHYKYMQTEFFLYNKRGMECLKPEHNRVIKYASYSVEGEYAKLITSAFGYHDNEYDINSGWRHKRKIKLEDLNKIDSCGMNFQELIMRANMKNLTFYENINEKDGEVQKLKLSYEE